MKKHVPAFLAISIVVVAVFLNIYGSKTDVSIYPHSVTFNAEGRPTVLNIEGTANSICKGEAGLLSGSITCDMTLFDTGISLRDKHLREYIRADKYKEATLNYTSNIATVKYPVDSEKDISKEGAFKGILEFAGVKKEVSGKVSKDDSSLKLEFKLDIREFDIAEPNFKGIGILPVVGITAVVHGILIPDTDSKRIRIVPDVSPKPPGRKLSN